MLAPPPMCNCPACLSVEPEFFVAPLASIKAIRAREPRQAPGRLYCPRCGERLGITEVVVDSVGYAHFVQPCAACLALWVLS